MKDLGDELGGFFALNSGPVNNIQRYDATNTFQAYSGVVGEPLFPLTPGEAYFVGLNSTVPYKPSHF